MKLNYLLLTVSSLFLTKGLCDTVYIDSPREGDVFKHGSTVTIDYRVQFEGMKSLRSASVAIVNPDKNTVVTYLPGGNWVDSPTGRRGGTTTWVIPNDLAPGRYSVRVGGTGTALCSKNNDGKPPYNQCKSSVEKSQDFTLID
ncbi:unnamed protein product [Cunninghamella blakesleeana]